VKVLHLLKIVLLFFFLFNAMTVCAEQEDIDISSLQQKNLENEYKKYAKGKNQEILFYGQIVDLNKNPVSYAKLLFSVRFYPESPYSYDFRHKEITTDKEGRFLFEDYGELLTLERISKEGYQYRIDYNPKRNFNFARNLKRKGPGFEVGKPMVFKVRKKAQPSLMRSNYLGFNLSKDKHFFLDLFRVEQAESSRLYPVNIIHKDWHPDVKVRFESVGNDINLILEMLDPDSGMIVDKDSEFFEEMTEAPVSGYLPKLVLPVEVGQNKSIRIYVKNEGGLFYSKLQVRYSGKEDRQYIGFGSNCKSNLTGDRMFEYSYELHSIYQKKSESQPEFRITRQKLRDGRVDLSSMGME
jgi:hypothetical protein